MPSLSEKIGLIILAVLFLLTYGCAGWIVLWGVVRRLRRKPRPSRSRVVRVVRAGVLALAVLGVACLAYAWLVEPYWPEITQYHLTTNKLPPGSGPVRIVHISDTHCEGDVEKLEGRLPQIIRDLKPDLIVFTGDAANNFAGVHRFRQLMTDLAQIAPTYGIRGNWDGMAGIFKGTGMVDLDKQTVEIDIKGAKLSLAGGPAEPWAPALAALEHTDPKRFVVLLHHKPDIILQLGDRKPDLLLAGHTHGGQICMPIIGAVVTLQETGKLFEHGLVKYGDTQVHVSRGLGTEGRLAPPIRFLCRPEISVIELRPE